MVRSWMTTPYLRDRRALVRQAARAHRERQYALTLPTILPLVEGLARLLCVQFVPREAGKSRRDKPGMETIVTAVVHLYDADGRASDYVTAVREIVANQIFKSYSFANEAPPSRVNRHGILHGQIPNYATEANSLRAFLLLDIVVRVARSLDRTGKNGEKG
jgi:hypothetical protein